jgi:hypothetical protein
MGNLNGAVVNHSDKKICYSISSEKLFLKNHKIKNNVGAGLSIGYSTIPEGKAHINANHKTTTNFDGKELKSLVSLKPNTSSTIGLEKI